ncbi:WD40/YVTN/BNR-like repeat-containing protein [Aliikangiella coralliicola]|uniref:Photosynthesis system II assembly factor Ycf48/Hcf136-like domain-containing protein n=1 Tax=Aliikangiella coralliicola TaxID=2592383 RepID=A0A545TWD3_9GAMM|nr:YCF48-related protein [Aliikangiella coralliicola]TQV81512.1 hypothetical protein FLL46_25525 [Aliikangiella coralliicola]
MLTIKKFMRTLVLISLLISTGTVGAQESGEALKLNTPAIKASQRLLMDVQSIENNRLVAVGERGHILLSDDQGESWRQVLIPTEALLTRLFFIDGKVGWAVGHQQVILKTEDAGESWVVQYSNDSLDQPALFDIWFKNANNGIAIGSYGLYLTTNDGGKTWEDVYLENLEDEEIGFSHFYAVAYEPDSKKLFMAGELGFLAVSDDLGQSWKKMDSPYEGSFFDIIELPNGYLLTLGLRGHLFRSKDLGESWEEITTGTVSGLQKALVLPTNKVLIVGSDGTQLISNDFGKSVKLFQRDDRAHLAGAVALPNHEILIVGIKGVLKAQLN